MTPKNRLTKKSASRTRTSQTRTSQTRTFCPRKSCLRPSRREAASNLKAYRRTVKFYRLGDEASAYYPGSEKPRYRLKNGLRKFKPKVSVKGGFTPKQVSLYKKTGSVGIGALRKNKLTQFGYRISSAEPMRKRSLDKAVKKYGELSVYRSLNAIAIYNKNTHPEISTVARTDRDFIKSKYFSHLV
jgi:hypothetical protein